MRFAPRSYTEAEKRTLQSFESIEYMPPNNQAYRDYIKSHKSASRALRWVAMGFIGFSVGMVGFWNKTLIDYIAAACIPVVVRPGNLLLPYEPSLDYDAFAVTVPFREITALPALLGGMSEAAVRAKRERLRQVHRMFLWDSEYGSAYEAARDMLLAALNRSAAR